MKKMLLFAAIAAFGLCTVSAQEIKLGASAALPVGDADDGYTFGAMAEFTYLFEINEAFKVGPTGGLMYYSGESVDTPIGDFDVEDALFLPIGGSARFVLDEAFFFGADLGYAIGLSPDGNDGGFLYKPKVGYNFGTVAIVASYSGIAVDGGNFSSINAGVEFSL